jgi:Cu(I)/Ag(I) efflux system membrane fusion protein
MKFTASTIVAGIKKRIGRFVLVLVCVGIGFLISSVLPSSDTAPDHTEDVPAAVAVETEWTCSMHPQVRSQKFGLCPLCSMDLIPVAKSGGEKSLREFSTSEAAKALMDIETSRVERKFVTAEVRMVGKVDYDETKLAYISAWVPGRLDRLYVDYTGVPVKKGDHLVYLYSPELLSAQEELIQAKAATVALQQSDSRIMREMTQATYLAAREKLRLLGLSQTQIATIEKTAKATDHITINSPVAGIVVHKNATEGMYVKTGTRIYTVADMSQMWIRLDAYESDLVWLRYGQRVEFTSIAYPGEVFRGTISFIDPVLDSATRTVKVRVNVGNPSGKLKPGMFIKAVVRSQVAGGGKVMDANLAGKWISPMHPEIIKDKPGTCDVCGMPLVRTESLGYVTVDPKTADRPLVIPVSAPLITGTRAIVYVELSGRDKPTYEGREIVLGPRAGDYYLVQSGLAEGDIVVTRGNFKIDSALQLSAKPSMMSPDGGTKPKSHQTLPAMAAHQIHQVLFGAEAASSAISTGRTTDQIRAAFAKLTTLLKAVDATALQGHSAMVWREYAMRLTNDAAAGQQAKTPKEIAQAAQSLRQNMVALRKNLGLDSSPSTPAPAMNATFLAQLKPLYQAYLAAQAALVVDDLAATKQAATQATKALGKVNMRLVKGKNHMVWMKATNALKQSLAQIDTAKTVKTAREAFAPYSEQMAALAARFGSSTNTVLFQVKCPMAFDNRGAIWLQDKQLISNPYFGDVMLRCGEIQTVIPVAKAADHE